MPSWKDRLDDATPKNNENPGSEMKCQIFLLQVLPFQAISMSTPFLFGFGILSELMIFFIGSLFFIPQQYFFSF